jgi:uncharacterized OsmC-like protein
MNYSIQARSQAGNDASVLIKQSTIDFGTTAGSEGQLPNPAELFLGSLAACILKNVERFSGIMNFTYDQAEVQISAIRFEKPPRMDEIIYELYIHSNDARLNMELLKKNIEKFGTIFNTVSTVCNISGTVIKK